MSADNKCFFCNNKCTADEIPSLSYTKRYCCSYCGEYILDPQDSTRLSGQIANKFKIACVLNERRLKKMGGIALNDKTDMNNKVLGLPRISINDILQEFPKKASDFFNRTILNLSRLTERPFGVIKLDTANEGDRLILFAPDREECFAFLRELEVQGFIRGKQNANLTLFFLTTKFWEIVENLRKEEVSNKRAFVAMWFHESTNDYYKEGIKKAIEDAGYDPVRIDLQDFNEKICDEIISEIKRTKFLVADFSGMRSGVFFEAGFAKGLGREVIFTLRKEYVEELNKHFDTRQYNHIVYDSPEDLRKKLYNRICATIV
jgi:nucleoside 2-deoxyribosyltransferase